MVELKPCPFCGTAPKPGWWQMEFEVSCLQCQFGISRHAVDFAGDRLPEYGADGAQDAATAAWNARYRRAE